MAHRQSKLMKGFDQETDALIDVILQGVAIDPADPLASKNKIRQNIKENLAGEEYRERIPKAYQSLQKDLRSHLSRVQFEALTDEFGQIYDKLELLSKQKADSFDELLEKMDAIPDSFQEIMGLSDETIEHCYQSGCRCFEAHHYKEAADIFFLLSVLSPYRFNIWLSQGLAEKKARHYDKALRAFAMATLIDMANIAPHIHSIECYLALHEMQNARDAWDLARNTVKKYPTEKAKEYETYLMNLKRKHFKN